MEIIGSNFDPPFGNPAWVHGCRLKRQSCRGAGDRSRLIWISVSFRQEPYVLLL
jgi:hypothetical protein